jgi:hypothetical protein
MTRTRSPEVTLDVVIDAVPTPTGVKEALIASCEEAASWRLHKAAEFRNERNLAAAYELADTADALASLPDDAPQLRRLAAMWQALPAPARPLAYCHQRSLVYNHGYGGPAALDTLLADLAHTLETLLDGRPIGLDKTHVA